MGTIKDLKFWSYKVLPLAYDDSLSYYEVVDKVAAKLNEVIGVTNDLPENISAEIKKQLAGGGDIFDNLFNGLINAIATKEGDSVTFTPNEKQGGEIIWLGDTLYEVVVPMQAGVNYIVGTNIVPVDIDGELNKIKGYISANNEYFHERAVSNHDTQTYLFWKDKLYRVDADIKVNDILAERVTVDGNTTGQLTLVNVMDEVTKHYLEMHDADNNLQTQIDGNDGDIEVLQNGLSKEITRATNEEKQIGLRISTIVAQGNEDNTEIVDARIENIPIRGQVANSLSDSLKTQFNYLYEGKYPKRIFIGDVTANYRYPVYGKKGDTLIFHFDTLPDNVTSCIIGLNDITGYKEEFNAIDTHGSYTLKNDITTFTIVDSNTSEHNVYVNVYVQIIDKDSDEIYIPELILNDNAILTINHTNDWGYVNVYSNDNNVYLANVYGVYSKVTNNIRFDKAFTYSELGNRLKLEYHGKITNLRMTFNNIDQYSYNNYFNKLLLYYSNCNASQIPIELQAGDYTIEINVESGGEISFDRIIYTTLPAGESTVKVKLNKPIHAFNNPNQLNIISLKVYATPTNPTVTQLFNKSYYALGDSFTHGDFTGYVDSKGKSGEESDAFSKEYNMYKTYVYWVGLNNGLRFNNLGVNGWTSKDIVNNKQYEKVPSNADYCTIMIGLNDFSQKIPIGDISDTEESETFYGYMNTILTWFRANRPWIHFGVLINAAYLGQGYRNALKSVAIKYGYPYLDLYSDPSVPAWMGKQDMDASIQSTLYSRCQVTSSNGHPNVNAYKLFSGSIGAFLNRI